MSRRDRATGDPNRLCKDCRAMPIQPPKRPAPYPGPRCDSHDLVFVKGQKQRTHERRVQTVYALKPGEYAGLVKLQGGRCWVCQRKVGVTKKAPLDHDHETCAPRGILCANCNRWVVTLRVEDLMRAIQYLQGITPYALLTNTLPR